MERIKKILKRLNEKIYMKSLLKIQVSDMAICKCGNDYGGFNVVPAFLDATQKERKLIIYSFGIGEDLSFSEAVDAKWDCEIYAFDPTPKAVQYVNGSAMAEKENFHFCEWGLSDRDGTGAFHLPKEQLFVPDYLVNGKRTEEVSGSLVEYDGVQDAISVELKTLKTIMQQLGHRQVDLLKMDIEGSEFAVIENILRASGGGVLFRQLCLEIHNRFFPNGRSLLKGLIKELNDAGYFIASVSDSMVEITFVHVSDRAVDTLHTIQK